MPRGRSGLGRAPGRVSGARGTILLQAGGPSGSRATAWAWGGGRGDTGWLSTGQWGAAPPCPGRPPVFGGRGPLNLLAPFEGHPVPTWLRPREWVHTAQSRALWSARRGAIPPFRPASRDGARLPGAMTAAARASPRPHPGAAVRCWHSGLRCRGRECGRAGCCTEGLSGASPRGRDGADAGLARPQPRDSGSRTDRPRVASHYDGDVTGTGSGRRGPSCSG